MGSSARTNPFPKKASSHAAADNAHGIDIAVRSATRNAVHVVQREAPRTSSHVKEEKGIAMSQSMNRRTFLKGATVGMLGATAAATGVLAGCSPATPQKTEPDQPVNSDVAKQPEPAATGDGASGEFFMDREKSEAEWTFQIAPDPIAETDIAETIEAEIIVVGAGTSGLVTAVAAAEKGADVVLFSASKAPCSRGGTNHAVNSKIMEREGLQPYDVQRIYERERTLAANGLDQRKWSIFLNHSEESMNWLIDLMESKGIPMNIETPAPHSLFGEEDPQYMPYAGHGAYSDDLAVGAGQPLVVNALAEILQELGGRITYQMKAEQLVRGDKPNGTSGRVSAVIARNLADNTFVKYVGTKAVVLATGDFSANKEMMAKYCPSMLSLIGDDAGEDYDVGAATTGLYKGDGQRMGLWVGAAWQHNVPNCPMVNVQQGTAAQPYCGHCGLVLNLNGKRFSDECAIHSYTGHAVLMQPEALSFPVWGTNYAADNAPWYKRGAWNAGEISVEDTLASWDKNVESGRFVKANTLDELFEQLGLPANEAKASVERYNELCAKGHDDDFLKRPSQMIAVAEAPFYGAKVGGRFLTVLGGLRTNPDFQVCEEDDTPIEGLYNIGTMVGDFYNNTYTFLMEGLNYGACVTLGQYLGYLLAEK